MRERLPKEVAKLHSQTLTQIKYYIVYRSGIAEKPNRHMRPERFEGLGQGSGNAPACWGFISDCLIRAYNKGAGPAELRSPISKINLEEKVQAFVDDTTCFLLVPHENGISLDALMRHNTQLWASLLNSTGGLLELPKCKFIILKWKFDADGNATLDSKKVYILSVESKDIL